MKLLICLLRVFSNYGEFIIIFKMEKSKTVKELPKIASLAKPRRSAKGKPYGARVALSIPNFRGLISTKDEDDI